MKQKLLIHNSKDRVNEMGCEDEGESAWATVSLLGEDGWKRRRNAANSFLSAA
jgi:hypothetical protein